MRTVINKFGVSGAARLGVWPLALAALAGCDNGAVSSATPPVNAPAVGGSSSSGPGTFPSGEGDSFPTVPKGKLFDGAVVQAKRAAPVVGGTLLVTRDGSTIVAADPDRDSVFLVEANSHRVSPVALQAGDEPGRVAEGASGTVYVALRRGGALAAIDVATAAVKKRVPVCAAPRGVAYDATSSSVYVACRSGLLLTLDAGDLSLKRSLTLDTDLRDVIVRQNDLVVTRFLSAEVLVVTSDGKVARRATPLPEPGCGEATVMFRALGLPSGSIALAHQVSSDATVNVQSGGYGFSCGGALVQRVVTTVDVDTPAARSGATGATGVPNLGDVDPVGGPTSPMTFVSSLAPNAGPLDIAVNAQGTKLALIALDESLPSIAFQSTPENAAAQSASLRLVPFTSAGAPDFSAAAVGTTAVRVAGQPVAVAFAADGTYIVQSREPATLELEGGTSVRLSTESHADTGHLMFHMDTGIGISCSSCHPEGGEDGHVWRFGAGLRRTLPLQGGVLERAPFHWDGTLADMGALVNEVMVQRMQLAALPSDDQIAALGSFLEQLPEPAAAEGLDAAAVSRGQALFQRVDVACASCHGGPQYTNNKLVDVGTGGMFVTPSLLGVGLRSPIFHDGCAKTVGERFGVCGGSAHGKPELLTAAEQADLTVFLRSL